MIEFARRIFCIFAHLIAFEASELFQSADIKASRRENAGDAHPEVPGRALELSDNTIEVMREALEEML